MKILRYLVLVAFISLTTVPLASLAQCSMCTLNAESSVQNGNTEGRGLNRAILYLLAAPYVAVAVIGYVWYKKYRKKDIALHIKDEKVSLN